QVDRARPADGHFNKWQPRRSVEIGTTNSREYLQSQTGNRRFWPLRVLKSIDIAKLKRDRMQLWGEAAYYQSHGESLVLDETLWARLAKSRRPGASVIRGRISSGTCRKWLKLAILRTASGERPRCGSSIMRVISFGSQRQTSWNTSSKFR